MGKNMKILKNHESILINTIHNMHDKKTPQNPKTLKTKKPLKAIFHPPDAFHGLSGQKNALFPPANACWPPFFVYFMGNS